MLPVWQLPMFPEYDEHIKGEVADIKNVGEGRWGGEAPPLPCSRQRWRGERGKTTYDPYVRERFALVRVCNS